MFGIDAFGYAFGADRQVADVAADYVPDPERVLRWGCRTFHRADETVTATDLAAAAARDALAGAGLTPADLDLVAVAVSELPEYPHWDSSAALARELKIERIQTMLLAEGCAAGVTGLGTLAGAFATQPELDTVLFVAVNRVSEFHRNRMNVNTAVHSDGAVAAVLRRDGARMRWLATDQFTDPDLCDWFRTDYGGAVAPVPPPGWSAATAPAGTERVHAHFDRDPRALRAFVDALSARSTEVVERACARAGTGTGELTHVFALNESLDAVADVARPFAIPAERTNAGLAAVHGHMGAADQLTVLGQRWDAGDLAPGDLVALTGTSIGMRWYCSLVRV
ncbi:3-oxoacyl-[acyl-carrier-protein] synthase III C-terminal domain-containing protein [Actinomadura algeriensis]|uniref:3-oxoacyl-[acyl-carrier-protein] synthase-3 n=1 Tax=Actinomadura algeriensis TaxID=1679523 RepID=A0ABR9JTM5_9ACTN|nr:3-oxoacyl-[acyl-carrier-protein] synthase III C-terminal domain-containing protein [Actinomadura algeriensis]MBE1533912.1 3-oxoacyl-[acyl-carrier-protein] synthase-3 [Actinomadura algeriensis]